MLKRLLTNLTGFCRVYLRCSSKELIGKRENRPRIDTRTNDLMYIITLLSHLFSVHTALNVNAVITATEIHACSRWCRCAPVTGSIPQYTHQAAVVTPQPTCSRSRTWADFLLAHSLRTQGFNLSPRIIDQQPVLTLSQVLAQILF